MKRMSRTQVHHKMAVTKFANGSAEFIGNIAISDEMYVAQGKLVIGADSEFRYNAISSKGVLEVFDGATLELQSGARVAPNGHTGWGQYNTSVYKGGTIQAGSPKRPIKKDAFFLLGIAKGKPNSRKAGFYAANESMIRVYSADPARARLVFSSITNRPHFYDRGLRNLGTPNKKAQGNQYGIELFLAGKMDLNGVMFDYVRRGGLQLQDRSVVKKWKNVFYGSHNAGSKETLIAPLSVPGNIYYHKRKHCDNPDGLIAHAAHSRCLTAATTSPAVM